MHPVEVLSSPNSPPLFIIVFWGETNRSSLLQMFFKIGVFKNFANFMGKRHCWSIFRSSFSQVFFKVAVPKKFHNIHRKSPVSESLFDKVAGLKAYNFNKKWLQHRCFPVKFAKVLRTPIFTDHLWWLLLNKFRRSLWFIVWRSDALVI